MDLKTPWLFTVLFILITLALKYLTKSTAKNAAPKLPPGPRKLPIIGNLHQLALAGPLVHRTLADLAKTYGPLMHLKLGEVNTMVASTPEMAKEILRTHDLTFSDRPPLLAIKILSYDFKGIAFTPHGKYLRQVRRLCATRLLGADSVQSLRPIREQAVSDLIREIRSSSDQPINLTEKIFSTTYTITSRAMFGSSCREQNEFKSIIEELQRLASGFCLADLYPSVKLFYAMSRFRVRLEKQFRMTDRMMENIIRRRRHERATKGDMGEMTEDSTLLDVLLSAKESGEFCIEDEHIKAVLLDLFIGGSETSSTMVEWAMAEMMKNPSIMREAQVEVRRVFQGKEKVDEASLHELNYLKMVVKETLRLHPPGPLLLPRENTERCEIDGYEIPAGSRVMVNAWAINRDPRFWDEPERFYPKRFCNNQVDYNGTYFEFISFGAGRRICPGLLFAMPNVELPLAQLLFHFDWDLPSGVRRESLDMSEEFGAAMRKKNTLVLVPIPFSSLE